MRRQTRQIIKVHSGSPSRCALFARHFCPTICNNIACDRFSFGRYFVTIRRAVAPRNSAISTAAILLYSSPGHAYFECVLAGIKSAVFCSKLKNFVGQSLMASNDVPCIITHADVAAVRSVRWVWWQGATQRPRTRAPQNTNVRPSTVSTS